MSLLKLHYKKTVQNDLSSRFLYNNVYQASKLKNVTLNLGIQESSLKTLLPNFLCLELIASNTPCLTKARKHSILFNLKKNAPNGVKLTLNQNQGYQFLQKLTFQIFPNLKNRTTQFLISQKDSFSFSVKNLADFQELTLFYNLFKNISGLDVTLKTTASSNLELTFFLTSFKLPGFCARK